MSPRFSGLAGCFKAVFAICHRAISVTAICLTQSAMLHLSGAGLKFIWASLNPAKELNTPCSVLVNKSTAPFLSLSVRVGLTNVKEERMQVANKTIIFFISNNLLGYK